jgi:hypothetical protein
MAGLAEIGEGAVAVKVGQIRARQNTENSSTIQLDRNIPKYSIRDNREAGGLEFRLESERWKRLL